MLIENFIAHSPFLLRWFQYRYRVAESREILFSFCVLYISYILRDDGCGIFLLWCTVHIALISPHNFQPFLWTVPVLDAFPDRDLDLDPPFEENSLNCHVSHGCLFLIRKSAFFHRAIFNFFVNCTVPAVLRIRIRIRIHRIHMFLGLLDPDPQVRGMDPDPALDPDPSIIMQK